MAKPVSLGAAALQSLQPHLTRLRTLAPDAAAGEDPEAVHQMRVSIRRLRSALRVFREAFTPEAIEASRASASFLAEALGTIRDADVFLEWLGKRAARLPAARAAELDRVRATIERRRHRALHDARELLAPRSLGVRLAPLDALSTPAARSPAWETPLTQAGPDRLELEFRTLRRRWKKVLRKPSAPRYHAARIAVKRLRYAADLLHSAGNRGGLRALARKLSRLQDDFGAYQDAEAFRGTLSEFVNAGAPPGSLAEEAPPAAADIPEALRALLRECDRTQKRLRPLLARRMKDFFSTYRARDIRRLGLRPRKTN